MRDLKFNYFMRMVVTSFLAIMLLMPLNIFASDSVTRVSSQDELVKAIEAVNNGADLDNHSIFLENDITLKNVRLMIQKGNTTIFGEGHELRLTNNSEIILKDVAKLNLGASDYDKTLVVRGEGGSSALFSTVYNANTELNMYHGVTLTNDGKMTMTQAGAVQLTGKAKFNMYGGTITGFSNMFSLNGGVVLDNQASFHMVDGIIENCVGVSGGAVAVFGGRFVMDGGIIRNSKDAYNGFRYNGGGGVYVGCSSNGSIGDSNTHPVIEETFIMNDGIIENCSAAHGGGVSLYGYSKYDYLPYFEMNGGMIRGCVAGENGGRGHGGGLFVNKGKAVIGENAIIYNNKALAMGDDIMSYGGSYAKLVLNSDPAKWDPNMSLDATDTRITKWFDDGDTRWMLPDAQNEGYLKPFDMDYLKNNEAERYALKAAHGVFYTLTYETNGGSLLEPEMYESDTVVELSLEPTKEGYRFAGWYSDSELKNKVTSVAMTGDITLYAKWDKIEANGGTEGDKGDIEDGSDVNGGESKDEVVPTGDSASFVLLLSIMLISLAGVVVTLGFKNQNFRKNK